MNNLTTFHFVDSLKDFLLARHGGQSIEYHFNGSPSVKDAMEALGVPPPEVAYIVCQGVYIDFNHQLRGGEYISFYPYCRPPLEGVKPLFPLMPVGRPLFIADVHLGRLARYMRVAGFDTIYEKKDMGDEAITAIAAAENRIVLTRDVGLLKRSIINYGYILRSSNSRQQFKEVVARYFLKPLFMPFSKCVHCNGLIKSIDKKEVMSSLPDGIKSNFEKFSICSQCGHIYWEGSHYKRIRIMLGAC